MEIIKIAAHNDSKGNPRRAFLVLHGGHIRAAYDEGFLGMSALPDKMRPLFKGVTIQTTPAEYRLYVKAYGGEEFLNYPDDMPGKP